MIFALMVIAAVVMYLVGGFCIMFMDVSDTIPYIGILLVYLASVSAVVGIIGLVLGGLGVEVSVNL